MSNREFVYKVGFDLADVDRILSGAEQQLGKLGRAVDNIDGKKIRLGISDDQQQSVKRMDQALLGLTKHAQELNSLDGSRFLSAMPDPTAFANTLKAAREQFDLRTALKPQPVDTSASFQALPNREAFADGMRVVREQAELRAAENAKAVFDRTEAEKTRIADRWAQVRANLEATAQASIKNDWDAREREKTALSKKWAEARANIEAAAQGAQRADYSAGQGFLASLRGQAEAIGKTHSELLALKASQLGVSEAAAPMIAALREAEKRTAGVGMSAAATAAAMRSVPAQFTDIVVSLQAGQSPMTVLLQQGGQLKDMFGGIGPAARALGGYVAGLVNPITVFGTVVAALGVAYKLGSDEADNFAKALILSGNAAGSSIAELTGMASRLGGITGSQHEAAAALAEMAASGKVASTSLEQYTASALRMERDVGTPISETVKRFEELGKAPVDASVKLNESMGYLTMTVYRQIKALEDEGRATEAAKLAQDAYSAAADSASASIVKRLGLIERGWRLIKEATFEAANAALGVGRPSTAQEQLATAEAQLQRPRSKQTSEAAYEATNAALRERIASLQEVVRLEAKNALAQREGTEQVRARAAFDRDGEQFKSKAVRREQEIAKARREGAQAGATDAEIEQRIAGIREKYKDPKNSGGDLKELRRLASAEVALEKAKGQEVREVALGNLAEQRRVVEQDRQSGLAGIGDYYDKLRAIDAAESAARLADIDSQIKAESDRKIKSRSDALQREAKLIELGGKRSAELQKAQSTQRTLTFQEDTAFLAAAEATYQRRQQSMDAARQAYQQLKDQNRTGQIALQADPQARAAMQAQEDVRKLQEVADQLTKRLKFEITPAMDTQAVESIQAQILAVNDETARAIVLRQQQLTEELKPEWQRMLDAWGNTSQRMREAGDAMMSNFLRNSEDAWVEFQKTGKVSIKTVVDGIQADLARLSFREMANSLAGFAKQGVDLLIGEGWDKFRGGGAEAAVSTSASVAKAALDKADMAAKQGGTLALAEFTAAVSTATVAVARMAGSGSAPTGGGFLSGLFGGADSAGPSLGGYPIDLTAAPAFAKGGAFTQQGMVRPFARGGAFMPGGEVIDRATFFKFASGGQFRSGVAGEAGPEAIIPLRRTSGGRLGVEVAGHGGSAGAGSGAQITIHNYAGADVQAQQTGATPDGMPIIEVIVRQAVAEVNRQVTQGGGSRDAIAKTFGLRPQLNRMG